MHASRYTSRFAPSPTGHLHLGSVYTALASFLDAKANQGFWQLRFDDLDTPRNVTGATTNILKTLETLGLHWDGEVDYQSLHLDEYHAVLENLLFEGKIYRCKCSRKDLTPIYAQTCRNQHIPANIPHSLRIKTDAREISFNDGLQGHISHNLAEQHGDFILKRRDNIVAYQFAVVLDDFRQNINHVVRGMDLLHETPKQIFLQQVLNLPTPNYVHVPILVNEKGEKLSKQTLAAAVDLTAPNLVLFNLLQLLNQNPPPALQAENVETILKWGIENWQLAQVR
ncbi:MAG: tRNA glutamyl-Q(34) synthetase GluQRS [Methylococcales bacterium]|nr:tRNA glutamyl-Q(34) synthetase GluQRS [Methylococcales bacterium]